jgi:hypothetical protein
MHGSMRGGWGGQAEPVAYSAKLRPTKYFLSQELSAGCLSPTRADK